MKFVTSKSRYIIVILIILILSALIYIKINYQDLKGQYIIFTQKDRLNTIVTFLKENCSSDLESISLSCDKSISKKTNEKVGFVEEIAYDDAISALKSLNKKYGEDNKYFYFADAYCDKSGKIAVLFTYYNKEVNSDYNCNIKYIVYVDNNFDMKYFPTHKNIKKIKGNWYTLSIITEG